MENHQDKWDKDNQNKFSDRASLIRSLEEQIEVAVWLQAFGQLSEAILLSKLLFISDNIDSHGEQKIVVGNWVQALGQIMEALGVSQELSTIDKEMILNAQKLAIAGSFIQSFGAQIEGFGGVEVIQEEKEGAELFVP